jgi:hypothetical protein
MEKKVYRLVLVFVIILSSVFLVIENFGNIHAMLIEEGAPSNVSVEKYIAISFSENLKEGILFGEVNVLPATNVNSSHNYDGVGNSTTFYINVSQDSNSAVDFCIRANANLTTSSLDIIGIGNQTYSNSTSSDSSSPALSQEVSLTGSYVKSSDTIPIGGVNYYRFWLDVPAGQSSGSYNNTISFKGLQSGLSC